MLLLCGKSCGKWRLQVAGPLRRCVGVCDVIAVCADVIEVVDRFVVGVEKLDAAVRRLTVPA